MFICGSGKNAQIAWETPRSDIPISFYEIHVKKCNAGDEKWTIHKIDYVADKTEFTMESCDFNTWGFFFISAAIRAREYYDCS